MQHCAFSDPCDPQQLDVQSLADGSSTLSGGATGIRQLNFRLGGGEERGLLVINESL